jgi:hypothetical protein
MYTVRQFLRYPRPRGLSAERLSIQRVMRLNAPQKDVGIDQNGDSS